MFAADDPVQPGPVLQDFHIHQAALLKKFRHGRALGFANLHGHQAPGLYQGRPQLGDGPVEHQAVPAAVQSRRTSG